MNSGRRVALSMLRGRSPRELAYRGAQTLAVGLERIGLDNGEIPPDRLFRMLTKDARQGHGTLGIWCESFRSRTGSRFFPGFDDPIATSQLGRALDESGCSALLARAERALHGSLDILGLHNVSVGNPVDWHRDPLLGIRAPDSHWSKIPYLDPAIVGDHKRVWEINRHQWLVMLAQAWLLTGDDRYPRAVTDALRSWMESNPPKRGINWASSLEVAFRAISWVWVLRLLRESAHLDNDVVSRMAGHLVLSARHIERNLSTYFSPNTHLTGEALALYYLGTELSEFEGAARWRETGRRILLEQLPIHVRADGTYFEQSTWYHRYTFDFYLHFQVLEQRAHGRSHSNVADALRRLAEVLLWISRPDGSMPLVGDDDGGRLLFLDGRMPNDTRPALASAAAVTGNPEFLAVGPPSMELPWLTGREGVARVQALTPRAPDACFRLFRDGGTLAWRSGWDDRASVMITDVGPHGVGSAGHSHADALTFDLCVDGAPIFVDPGTCEYTANPETRDRFRHTAAHNGATVDGAPSSEMRGPFKWGHQAASHVERYSAEGGNAYLRARHDGFLRLLPSVAYTRTIFFVSEGIWVIRDAFVGVAPILAEVHFQCASDVTAELTMPRSALLRIQNRPAAHVWTTDAATIVVGEGEVSSAFGTAVSAPHLRVSVSPAQRVALYSVIASPSIGVEQVESATNGNALITVTRPDVVDYFGFGPCDDDAMQVRVAAEGWWLQRDRATGAVRGWMGAECTRFQVGDAVLKS
jgi:hypothetical protein